MNETTTSSTTIEEGGAPPLATDGLRHSAPSVEPSKLHKVKYRVPRRRPERLPDKVLGYGWSHKRTRAELGPFVASGGAVCARCGELIVPGEPWDLDHDDEDRGRYLGPSHRRCNRATAVRRRVSRSW